MSIPDYQSLMRPLLAFASDGSEKNINDGIKGITDQLKLTDDERHQLLPSGKQAIFANRVHRARTYLDNAGAIKRALLQLLIKLAIGPNKQKRTLLDVWKTQKRPHFALNKALLVSERELPQWALSKT